jgi:hypothetical protein
VPTSTSRRRGREYENHAIAWLRGQFGPRLWTDLWFEYELYDGETGALKPDAIITCKHSIVLVETKVVPSLRMWWQLRFVYGPLAREAFPDMSVRDLAICAHYPSRECWASFIQQPTLIHNPLDASHTGFSLIILPTPKRIALGNGEGQHDGI